MLLSRGARCLALMDVGSYIRLEGVQIAGAVSLYVRAKRGAF